MFYLKQYVLFQNMCFSAFTTVIAPVSWFQQTYCFRKFTYTGALVATSVLVALSSNTLFSKTRLSIHTGLFWTPKPPWSHQCIYLMWYFCSIQSNQVNTTHWVDEHLNITAILIMFRRPVWQHVWDVNSRVPEWNEMTYSDACVMPLNENGSSLPAPTKIRYNVGPPR